MLSFKSRAKKKKEYMLHDSIYTKCKLIYSDRNRSPGDWGWTGKATAVLNILIVVMVSQAHAYIKTNQKAHFNMRHLLYTYHLSVKLWEKNK